MIFSNFSGPFLYTSETEIWRFIPGSPPESLFIFSFPGYDSFRDAAISLDSHHVYILTNTSYNSPTNGHRMVVAKVDLEGNVIWQKILDRGFHIEGDKMEVLPNGNLVIGGFAGTPETAYDWTVFCFDPYGNLLWERTWFRPEIETLRSMSIGNNGDILIGGDAYDPDSISETRPTIMALDEEGNERWTVHIPDSSIWDSGLFGSMAVDPDGNIYAVEQDAKDYFYKLSPDGDILWKKKGINRGFVRIDRDGNIILVGEYAEVNPPGVTVRKYNPEGHLLFENLLYADFRIVALDMILTSDGGIAFCGGVPDTSTTRLVGDLLFVKFNCEGQLVANANSCNPEPEFNYPLVSNLLIKDDLLSAPLLSHPEGLSAVIELYDLMGRRVAIWGGESNRNTGIDLSGFSESWYLYRLRSEDKVVRTGRIQLVR